MTLDTFFEKFELLADAPDAVARMRELVLGLLFDGHLLNDCQECRLAPLGDLLAVTSINGVSKGPSPSGGTEILRISAGTSRRDFFVDEDDFKHVDLPAEEVEKFVLIQGDLLACRYNGNLHYVGRFSYYRGDSGRTQVNPDKLIRFRIDSSQHCPRYVCYAMNSRGARTVIESMCATTAGNIGLSAGRLKTVEIPVPPLAEQKRIVAKVEELMALCDRLEAQQKERAKRHAALARASLARFAEAPTPAHLDLLFHPSYDIPPAELKKAILTLAVQGKLVEQDASEVPAEELLRHLEEQRAILAKGANLRLPKNVPPVSSNDSPHRIPQTWQWVRLGGLALVIDYGTSQKSHDDSSKVPVYRMGNIVGGKVIDENLKYVDKGIADLPGLYLKHGDILFNRTNSYELVGKSGLFTGDDDSATFASYLIRIRLPNEHLLPSYFSLAMNAPYFRQTQIEPEVVQQCGQANFNGSKLATTLVPVPPLKEQRRIVAKVEQLMALVGHIEAQIGSRNKSSTELLVAFGAGLAPS